MATFEMEESSFSGYMDDDTIVTAVVSAVKIQEKPYVDDDGTKVKKVVFKFAVDEPDNDHDGQTVYGETPMRFNNHPDCKLANWSREILAAELPVGYRLDTDMLVGQRCRIVVGLREYQKDGETKQTNFVKDVMRSRDAMAGVGGGPIDEPF
jgi:hypothetical protein